LENFTPASAAAFPDTAAAWDTASGAGDKPRAL
jgi:hypothetical protein